MSLLDRRVAKLEAVSNGPSRVQVLSIGAARGDAGKAEAEARLLPDAKPADIVVIVRRFADPDAPAEVVRLTGRHEDWVAANEERLRAHEPAAWKTAGG